MVTGQSEPCTWPATMLTRGPGMYAAGAWLRRMARDPGVNPWLLLDQLTAPETCLSGKGRASARGERGALGIRRQHRTGAGWMTAR